MEKGKKWYNFPHIVGPSVFKLLRNLVSAAKPGEKTYANRALQAYSIRDHPTLQILQLIPEARRIGGNFSCGVMSIG